LVYGIIGGVVILYMALKAREHPERLEEPKPLLWGSIKNLVSNPKFWIAGLTNAFYSGAMSLVMAGLPFYAKYTLGISDLQTTLMFATVLLVAIGAVALWAQFVKRFDLMKVWRAAMLALVLAYIPLYLPPPSSQRCSRRFWLVSASPASLPPWIWCRRASWTKTTPRTKCTARASSATR